MMIRRRTEVSIATVKNMANKSSPIRWMFSSNFWLVTTLTGMTKPKATPNCKKGKRKPWNFLDSFDFSFEVCSSSKGEQKIKFVKILGYCLNSHIGHPLGIQSPKPLLTARQERGNHGISLICSTLRNFLLKSAAAATTKVSRKKRF